MEEPPPAQGIKDLTGLARISKLLPKVSKLLTKATSISPSAIGSNARSLINKPAPTILFNNGIEPIAPTSLSSNKFLNSLVPDIGCPRIKSPKSSA